MVSASKNIKVAVYGNYAMQFLVKALKQMFKGKFVDAEIYEAGYDQTELDFFYAESDLYKFAPEFILIHESADNVKDKFYSSSIDERRLFASAFIVRLEQIGALVEENLPHAKIIYPTWEAEDDMVYGNLSYKVSSSWGYQLREYNWLLVGLLQKHRCFSLIDINRIILAESEKKNYSFSISADLQFSLSVVNRLAQEVVQYINVFLFGAAKCIILDLDNTLWGGIIGDDGIENIQVGNLGIGKAFTKLQTWLKELKERGIILTVCSKNNEDVAKEPFLKHAGMVLKLEDIAVFVANWNNKADNIRHIQSILNISFDSMVFLDDNPAERQIVKDNLPEVIVPDLPEDPAYYLPYLKELNLFETTAVSANDKDRTKQYQEEAKRVELSSRVTNIEEYLESLEMKATIEPFKKEDYSRIAQLTQRSNQFNLRTIRYSDTDIEQIVNNQDYLTYSVKLRDKFGDYGLISVLILSKQNNSIFIDTWLMSCRVLKRGVEQMLLNYLLKKTEEIGATQLTGEYIATSKNKLAERHYADLGFENSDGLWLLKVSDGKRFNHFIKVSGN